MGDLAQRLKPQEWLQLWAPRRIAIVARCRGLKAATLNGHQLRWARRLALLRVKDSTIDLQFAEALDKSWCELAPGWRTRELEIDDFWAEVLRSPNREGITTFEADAREFIADKYRCWAMEKGLPGLSNYAVRTWQRNKGEKAGDWFSFEVMGRRTEAARGPTSSEPELITPADLAGLQLDESWTRLLGSAATFCDVTVRTVPYGFSLFAPDGQAEPRERVPKPPKAMPAELDAWMEANVGRNSKRDSVIKDCTSATGALWRDAIAAWDRLPSERKKSRGSRPASIFS
ncbi:MAG: hypothetical protein JWL84_5574 [Rhodospirillales bacterium]|nr:hypothetical protein [Rhodospirillales bacterium]